MGENPGRPCGVIAIRKTVFLALVLFLALIYFLGSLQLFREARFLPKEPPVDSVSFFAASRRGASIGKNLQESKRNFQEGDDDGVALLQNKAGNSGMRDDNIAKVAAAADADADGGNQKSRTDGYSNRKMKLSKPIINVGFPKAGTSSIFRFFHCNGLKSQHWYCCGEQNDPGNTTNPLLMSSCILGNLATGRLLFEGCGEYDVYAEINGPRIKHDQGKEEATLLDDGRLVSERFKPRILLPQHHYLDKIHEQFPNATFILNLRPVDSWVISVLNWPSGLKVELGHEFYAQQVERNFPAFGNDWSAPRPPRTLTELIGFLRFLYQYHSQHVRDFVQQHPSHALVEIDITKNDTGKILAEAFGGLDANCWGHHNKFKGSRQHRPSQKSKGNWQGGQDQELIANISNRLGLVPDYRTYRMEKIGRAEERLSRMRHQKMGQR